jgi:hypothetical protein
MKRLTLTIASLLSLVTLSLGGLASAASSWYLNPIKPASEVNTRSFNIQYSVLSTQADVFTVTLTNTGPAAFDQSQQTNVDPHGVNGNSGSFALTNVPDGHYTFTVTATRNGSADTAQSRSATVDVDATAPAAPTYNGKTRNGNTYSVSFTAPSTSDVKYIKVFASTSTTFIANNTTQVGEVAVNPGDPVTFNYLAPDGTARYFAVQAFDSAGNGSTLTGDPNIVVTTTFVGGQGGGAPVNTAAATGGAGGVGGGAGAAGAAGTTPAGEVQGAATNKQDSNGQVGTDAASTIGDVLGTTDNKASTSRSGQKTAGIILAVVAVAAAAYYWFVYRPRRIV